MSVRESIPMSPYQLVAYRSPCFEGRETTRPAFRHVEQWDGKIISVILTVNIGLE